MNAERKFIKCIIGLMAVLFVLGTAFAPVSALAEESSATGARTQIIENNTEVVRFDYRSDAAKVLVTLTNPADLPENAVLSVTPVAITEDMQATLDQEAINKQKAIESAAAFDIKFLVDGQEVQPGNTVKVQVSLPEITAGANADVYHFDEAAKAAEDMNAAVTPEGQVEFDTTHFSTYIIVNTSYEPVKLTLQHYSDETKEAIYAEDVRQLSAGDRVNDYKKAINWDVSRVVKVKDDGTEIAVNNPDDIRLTQDTTIRVYYEPSSKTSRGDVTFYDYMVQPTDNQTFKGKKDVTDSINNPNNYPQNSIKANRFAIGTLDANKWYKYDTVLNNNHINKWSKATDYKICDGIVKELSDDYKEVIFNVDDPGVFSDDDKYGKKILKNYQLQFAQLGDTYTLNQVFNANGEKTLSDNFKGSNFFPLDSDGYKKTDKAYNQNHNYYFGMRYDVEFKLGDYTGPLEYKFTGDDDLWVILDGKKVVVDVGGIHNAIEQKTDLWEDLGITPGEQTEEQKNEVHRLTVLYMERGANLSNCQMNFTLPNAQIISVTQAPKTDLDFLKVDSQGSPLPGATFKLINDETKQEQVASSDENGKVHFINLVQGEYTLTETIAPDGYTASSDTWKVKVTTDGDGKTAAATLYQSDGTTPVEGNQIINYTSQEIIDKTVERNKTATVDSWDDRTYNIHLDASSKLTEPAKSSTPYDIVLVLDSSGSMSEKLTGHTMYNEGDTIGSTKTYYYKTDSGIFQKMDKVIENTLLRYYKCTDSDTGKEIHFKVKNQKFDLTDAQKGRVYIASASSTVTKQDALEAAAASFLDKVQEKSPDSRVGVVTFGTNSEIKETKIDEKIYTLLKVGTKDSLDQLKEWVKISPDGATVADKGLENAEEVFTDGKHWQEVEQKDGREKLVVFFTDGVPTTQAEFDNNVANSAIESAKGIKKNATIYSIGIFDDANENGVLVTNNSGPVGTIKQVDNYMKSIASSQSCYMTADNMDELTKLFGEIVENMGKAIKGATITDIIDSRFELAEGEKARLEAAGANITVNSDGTTTIVWSNQTINSKTSGGKAGWTEDFKVIAKQDYLGDNNVPTNAPGSGIDCGIDAFVPFPQPVVNVKADISLLDQANTIFWDETVPANGALIDRVNELQTLIDKNVRDYKVPEASLNIAWTNEDGTLYSIDAMTKDKPEKDTYYNVAVTYNASPSTDKSNANTKGDKNGVKGDHAQNTLSSKGQYTVHVVKGQLQITKEINDQYTKIRQINANQTFVFKIERYAVDANNNKIGDTPAETFYETINFNANETEAKSKSKLISGLKKGYYTVTEETNWSQKYELDKKTDNFEGNREETVDLLIGKHLKEAANNDGKPEFYGLDETELHDSDGNVLSQQYSDFAEGKKAEVTFTNHLNTAWKWLSDTAAAVNVFSR